MQYDLSLQLSSFFALLILSENVTPESVASMGEVNIYLLAFKLRQRLKSSGIDIKSRRTIGYWLDADVRRTLAGKLNIELGIGI